MAEEKTQHIPPLKDLDPGTPPRKRRWILWLVLFVGFILLFFSALPIYLISKLPSGLTEVFFSDIVQDVVLDDSGRALKSPRKYAPDAPLSILSHSSGVCFYFSKDESTPFDRSMRAEIIAVDAQKREYRLDEISVEEVFDQTLGDKGGQAVALCQKVNRAHSALPYAFAAVYMRPLAPFQPYKVLWITMRETPTGY